MLTDEITEIHPLGWLEDRISKAKAQNWGDGYLKDLELMQNYLLDLESGDITTDERQALERATGWKRHLNGAWTRGALSTVKPVHPYRKIRSLKDLEKVIRQIHHYCGMPFDEYEPSIFVPLRGRYHEPLPENVRGWTAYVLRGGSEGHYLHVGPVVTAPDPHLAGTYTPTLLAKSLGRPVRELYRFAAGLQALLQGDLAELPDGTGNLTFAWPTFEITY